MNKIVLSLLAAMAASAALGQGYISMNSYQAGGWLAFYDIETSSRATNATVGLYWSATGTLGTYPYTGWTLVGPTANTTSTGTAAAWGFVNSASGGGNRDLEAFRRTLYFQLRAWTGGYASWEAASASGNSSVQLSWLHGDHGAPIVEAMTQASTSSPVPTINWAPGSTSANPLLVYMGGIPEPNTIALAGLGLLGLIFNRRHK